MKISRLRFLVWSRARVTKNFRKNGRKIVKFFRPTQNAFFFDISKTQPSNFMKSIMGFLRNRNLKNQLKKQFDLLKAVTLSRAIEIRWIFGRAKLMKIHFFPEQCMRDMSYLCSWQQDLYSSFFIWDPVVFVVFQPTSNQKSSLKTHSEWFYSWVISSI